MTDTSISHCLQQEKMSAKQRRAAKTEMVQHIWDAIVSIRQQRQIANYERIANYVRRKHNSDMNELQKQLELAVADKLLDLKKTVGCKGSKVGIEQEAYRIPDVQISKEDHDWYCFECHKEGEVLCCATCHRVYHYTCVQEEISEEDKYICSFCQAIKSKEAMKLKKDELNMLLSYTCLRLKDKVISCRELLKMLVVDDEAWRHKLLLYQEMDLLTMEEKTQENIYKRLEEFQADAQTIVHNIVIYYGVLSPVADIARTMLRDCCYELAEIKQCRDCYKMSNEKAEKFWFCKPCNPPHDLVFAKQKGFPYWPAKLISIGADNKYDVRFFGGYHQRAKIDKECIKPITVNLQQLQLKRSVGLNKALDELKRHQQFLGQSPTNPSPAPKSNKKTRSRPASSSSSRSGSGSRSRFHKGSASSDDDLSENEADNTSRDECPTSSSPKVPHLKVKDVPTPEDHNVVSSSCQESPNPKVNVSTQTSKKLLSSVIPPPKPERAEEKEPSPINCDCESKYGKIFKEFKERLEKEQREDKEKSLRDLAESLRKDFEAEKQKLVSSALEKLQLEVDEAKRKAEEELRLSQQMELTDLVERQKAEISETKKKQWCYNCEAEAIYHCCWNTSYCSVECQQIHWHKEHKRTCRRKR